MKPKKRQKPISLFPVATEEVIGDMFKTKPPTKGGKLGAEASLPKVKDRRRTPQVNKTKI